MSIKEPLPGLTGDARARRVAVMFARISRRYDLMNTVMTGGMHHLWRWKAALLAARDLEGLGLDVATGTGGLAVALARQRGVRRVVGLDFVPEMVHLARQKVQRRSAWQKFAFVQGDALSLPFPDNAFACVTCAFGLRNTVDISRALAEMARVARPGGRVVILEIVTAQTEGPLQRLFSLYFHRAIPVLGRLLSGEREAYTYLPRSVDVFPLADELAHLMERAGLHTVRYQSVGMGLVAIHTGEKA